MSTPHPRDLFDISGRTAIVTGGTRGLGHSIAAGFAAVGAYVVLTGRQQESCDAAADAIAATLGPDGGAVIGVATHQGDPEAQGRLVERTVAEFGGIDIIVNNAGVSLGMSVEDLSLAALQKSLDVNLIGPLVLMQQALPHLERSSGASVINVLTTGLFRLAPDLSAYFASKSALFALTRTMALELGCKGIRVNAIAPGAFATEMLMNADESLRDGSIAGAALGRLADPDELIGTAIYLASAASSFTSAECIVVDGGYAI